MNNDRTRSINHTKITISGIRRKTDNEVLEMLRDFPYESQWINKDAFNHAKLTLCHIQGRRYMRTGNVGAFKGTDYR